MSTTDHRIAAAVATASSDRVDHCAEVMRHCLRQLSIEQIWWRPHESMNSVGNLVLHLCGNIRQWIINGVGEQPDTRDRPGEFAMRDELTADELSARLAEVQFEVRQTLDRLTDEALLASRRIQGFELTVLSAIFDSVPHFKGHTQEIVFLTRLQCGEAYEFHWTPLTPEEGAQC